KHKTDHNIFFIDASKEFEKGQNQNILREQEIDKIVKIYRERKDVDKYAHLATPDEIRDNDYNLNIPRYVDTFEPEPPVDVHKLVEDFTKTTQEINQTTNEIISMMDDLEGTTLESQKELNIVREMLRNGQTTESTF
ncbi:MAG: N-6 DNA methylase, partial [Lentilactobacillus hilgardii]|uniref:N-6 DNA methylase n=3 Tax=Lactobacillales TaxID=186826 RepID=UPI0039E8378A